MKTAILRMATSRSRGERRWKARLGHDSGEVVFRHSNSPTHPLNGAWFLWGFHQHRGGAGGLMLPDRREEVRRMALALIARQEHDCGIFGPPGHNRARPPN